MMMVVVVVIILKKVVFGNQSEHFLSMVMARRSGPMGPADHPAGSDRSSKGARAVYQAFTLLDEAGIQGPP